MRCLVAGALAFLVLFGIGGAASAQNAPQQPLLKPAQLDQLVAPIALYPDTLLSEVLMASTYPLEVVEADRWLSDNKNLQGDALKAAVDKQDWDDSVKSLTATPSVLDMMSQKLDWTQNLGNAVIAQQPDVMDSIQRLRSKAQANNKLASNQQQTVTTEQQNGRQAIVIAPTDPDTVYVPYYDPGVVYGAWPYPDYPPYYWPAPGYIAAGVIATGIAFGAGYALGRWASNGYRWGGGLNWGGNNIVANRSINVNNINRNNVWRHNPARGGPANRGNRENLNFRGRNGNQVLHPGNARPALNGGNGPQRDIGNRTNNRAGNRPGANGGGERRNAGNRGAGNRPNVAGRGGRPNGGRPSGGRPNVARPNIGGGGRRPAAHIGGGGGRPAMRGGGGGGHPRGGGGGGRGRRSDLALKHDVVWLGNLNDGLGFYRFAYNGSDKPYVGVIAQEVQTVMPAAVSRGTGGYLRVRYDMLGVKFETYNQWISSGAHVPAGPAMQ